MTIFYFSFKEIFNAKLTFEFKTKCINEEFDLSYKMALSGYE